MAAHHSGCRRCADDTFGAGKDLPHQLVTRPKKCMADPFESLIMLTFALFSAVSKKRFVKHAQGVSKMGVPGRGEIEKFGFMIAESDMSCKDNFYLEPF